MSGETCIAAVRRLILDCAMLLDDGEVACWPAFFTPNATYRITTRQNEAAGHPLSIMWCDGHAGLYDRVEAIERANVFEPHFYCHVLSITQPLEEAEDRFLGRTNFVCIRTMLDGSTMPFVSGHYRDEIVRQDGRWLFRSRTVVLDQSRIDTLIAIPL
jgi:anthranilate 1,2-dioxygenase small subunit